MCVIVCAAAASTVQAQVPSLPPPPTSTPDLPTAPELPTTPELPPAPSVPTAPAPAPVPTDPVPAPELPAPALPSPSLPTPTAPAPTLPQAPGATLPQAPDATLPSAPTLGGTGDALGDAGGALGEIGGALGGTPLQQTADGIPIVPGSGTAASVLFPGAGGTTLPGALPEQIAQLLANATPKQLRRLVRRLWDTPLRGRQLKRLRQFVEQRAGCLDVIPDSSRRVLVLRAGLAGRTPATRRMIARRLGISLRRVLVLENVAVTSLARACETPADAGALVLGKSLQFALDDASHVRTPVAADAANDGDGKTRVLGVRESGAPDIARMQLLEDGDTGSAVSRTLLAFLAVVLALIGAGVLATRRGLVPAALPAVLPRRRDGRPILFVDVDGVIAVDPFTRRLPPGDWHSAGYSEIYVPDRAGEFLHVLASRFELVWATGWQHGANTHLLKPLGLDEELAVVRFRKGMTSSTSEWKIEAVERYARRRPAAWIDDNISGRHRGWAAKRSAPTKLVQTDPHAGICEEHVSELMRWAEELERAEAESKTRTG